MNFKSIIRNTVIAASLLTSVAFAADRRIMIINDSSYVVTSFYASSVRTSDWEENIFHGKHLYPGHRVMVNLNDGSGGCVMDLRALGRNGRQWNASAQNICVVETWTLYD